MTLNTRVARVPGRPVGCLLATVAAAALLAGCGSSGGASKPAATASAHTAHPTTTSTSTAGSASATTNSTIDLCTLLTAAQVTAINHVDYDSTSTVNASTFRGCQYHNAGKSRVDITSLDITLLSNPGCWAVAKETDGPGTAVPGVGDAAFGYSLGLDVKHGDSCLTIEGQTEAESNHDWGPDTVMARALLQKLF